MIFAELFSVLLRIAELAFAAIVAGLNGDYLHLARHVSSRYLARFIYTEVVAGFSILLAIIWLIPFSGSFIHWPVDLLISIAWFISFGLLVDWLNGACGYVFDWDHLDLYETNTCPQWKATVAFAFLSAIFWLASAILGIYWVGRHTTTDVVVGRRPYHRRWYRSRV